MRTAVLASLGWEIAVASPASIGSGWAVAKEPLDRIGLEWTSWMGGTLAGVAAAKRAGGALRVEASSKELPKKARLRTAISRDAREGWGAIAG